jgi:arylsulfatase A
LLAACNPDSPTKMDVEKPHIVLIVADDLGYGDLGCYGATKIETPAIDQMASEGMRFSNAYASSSVCSPSRYNILTGRYAWRTRLQDKVLKNFDKPLIEAERKTIASLLSEQGYFTACVGKWHLGFDWALKDSAPDNAEESVFNSWEPDVQEFIDFSKPVKGGPVERGFDYFYGMAGSNNMHPYVYIENDRVTEPPSEEQKPYDHYVNALKAPNWDIKTVNQILTHKAVDMIHTHFSTRSNQPFFLYFPTSAIHRPCLPTFTKGKSKAGLRGDIVVELDWSVKEIVSALKEEGVYENTLLIFTSDNGPRPGDPVVWLDRYEEEVYEEYHQPYFDNYSPEYVNENGNLIWKDGWLTYGHRSAGHLLGFKVDAWEGGFRVPLIARWPKHINPETLNGNMVCLGDLFATLADLFDVQLQENEGEDSYSFLSNLTDVNAPQVRKSMTIAGGASGAMVEIAGGWKYIEAARPDGWLETYYPNGPSNMEPQLYYLIEDDSEQNNVYEQRPEEVSELKAIIKKVKIQTQTEGN